MAGTSTRICSVSPGLKRRERIETIETIETQQILMVNHEKRFGIYFDDLGLGI